MFHKWLLAVARSNQTLTVTRSKHDMYSHNLPTNTCELTTELQGKLKKFKLQTGNRLLAFKINTFQKVRALGGWQVFADKLAYFMQTMTKVSGDYEHREGP